MKRAYGLIVWAVLCLAAFAASAFGGGLSTDGCQLWTQDSPGISGEAERDDGFGRSLVAGDFNGDGYSDLAVGVQGEERSGVAGCGVVNIIYGGAGGLSGVGEQILHQELAGIGETFEEGDKFGYALAVADFDNDGYDDLVVGVPYEDISDLEDAGLVHVLPGSADGIDTAHSRFLLEDVLTLGGQAHYMFGWSLAAGYFNDDEYADLAIGVPYRDLGATDSVGAVHVVHGSATGLDFLDAQFWTQNSTGIHGVAEYRDKFGYALAAGDFDGNGIDDLAIGSPGEDGDAEETDCGALNLIYGAADGLDATGSQLFLHGDLLPNPNGTEANDSFGSSLSCGDYNGDGYMDIAVGILTESIDSAAFCGAVQVAYGGDPGISALNSQLWHQNKSGVAGQCEMLDRFGAAIASGNFDSDCCDDIAIGVPSEGIDDKGESGLVYVAYGLDQSGLSADRGRAFHQGQSGVLGEAGPLESMGAALAKGDFNGDGTDDLAVGVPGENVGDLGAGGVLVFYGVPGWDAGCVSLGAGWRNSDWFGDYAPLDDGWIWHLQHQYYYVTPDSVPDNIYFYASDMAWLWTSSSMYPYYYRFSDGEWLWYQEGSKDPRWFVVLDTGEWEQH